MRPPRATAAALAAALFAALLAALLLGGCSGMRLAYNTADFLIERYADDYLGLDRAQMARWSPELDAALARHRQEELPYLAAFFDTMQNDARKGFTRADVDCLLDQFETIYQRHFRLAAATAAPLLADLDNAQINALERTFREDAQDDAEDAARPVSVRVDKRVERYADNMQWWVGELSERQRGIVRDVVSGLPESADWYAYRDRKRGELIRLLRSGASAPRIEAFLNAWLVDYADMPAGLRRDRTELRGDIADLILRLSESFSAEQRRRLIDRAAGLRNDFMTLQPDARMAPVGCR
ncbi:DUF6279 family lipoprotein [Thiohalocapsa sp. ML1]|jgi:uncharacterized membrane-anchored protein YhcB (DUF1043 family)|uniref:DUF6279 family lipoprotein n=1 Tax=Thiohalocapsa sp. ML1 TaxID=1431688 RepID=UPI00073233E8|nr:DUF6279 family lipoprotein [Thiohalocapsa sp. ML1]